MKPEIQNIIDIILARDSQDERRASATLSQIEEAIEELVEHPTCETCAHWGNTSKVDELERKNCSKVEQFNNAGEAILLPVTYDDFYSEKPELFTKPNFYCKLHKPKEIK